MLSFFLGGNLGIKWLGRMVGYVFKHWRNGQLFSQVVVPFYISTDSVWRFQLLQLFINVRCDQSFMLAFLIGVLCSGSSSFHVLICYHIPSLLKYLFKSIAHIFTGLFEFLWLSFENSLYMLTTRPLSDIGCANIFFQAVVCLFFLLTSIFGRAEVLNFDNAPFINLFLYGWHFSCSIQ